MRVYKTQQQLISERKRRTMWSIAAACATGAIATAVVWTTPWRGGSPARIDGSPFAYARVVEPKTQKQLEGGRGWWIEPTNTHRRGSNDTRVSAEFASAAFENGPADPYAPPDAPKAQPNPGSPSREAPVVVASTSDESPALGTPTVVNETAVSGNKIVLAVNRTTVLTTKDRFKQVSTGQPEIAEVTPIGPNSVMVTAKKPGATQVIIWDENDRSQVIDVTVTIDLQALEDQLRKAFPSAKISVEAVSGAIALRGTAPSLEIAEQVVATASPFSEKILNFIEISGGQQVMLQVRFLEMSRVASEELGINLAARWINPGHAGFEGIGPGVVRKGVTSALPISTLTGSAVWDSFALDFALTALKQNNLARVLAEPNVTVISGQEASMLAGGEFPVPVPQSGSGGGSTITIEYREFGVKLNVTPIVLGNGQIRLKVAPEVSDLDFSSPVVIENNNIPIINKRKVQSTVEMGDGQTFAIAGLLKHNLTSTKNVTPLLGELPIIGPLFRSVRYQRQETELVVLVTPRIVEPMNPGEIPAIPGMKWRYPNPVDFYLNGDLGGPALQEPRHAMPPRFRGSYGFAPATQCASVER